MDNPASKDILTVIAILAAIYIGKKEIEEIKTFRTSSKSQAKSVKPQSKPSRNLTLNTEEEPEDNETPSEKSEQVQEIIYTAGTNPDAWQVQCGEKTNSFQGRVYCSCYNNQWANNTPNLPTLPTLPVVDGKVSVNGLKWPASGTFYHQTNSGKTPPTDQIRWSGGPPIVNPGYLVGFYLQYAWSNIPIVGGNPPWKP